MPRKASAKEQRLDRVDATLDRIAEETASFRLAVGGATTRQIADNSRLIAENSRLIRELAEITRENSRKWEQLRREFGFPL